MLRLAKKRKLRFTGRLKVIEASGAWGVYAGERIVLGEGKSFRDDLGVRVREAFQPGAADALGSGESPSESFQLSRVRVTIERLD